jgi:2-polyprenyl-3-methyl-5-hydroxy-6-metoxy-1,4-benzoquinol methylase
MSKNPPSDAADHWNRRFKGPDFLFGTEPNQWLCNHATAFASQGRVLCVADGEGRNSVWLAKQGFQVDAFDIADIAVGKARRFAARAGVTVNYQIAASPGRRRAMTASPRFLCSLPIRRSANDCSDIWPKV